MNNELLTIEVMGTLAPLAAGARDHLLDARLALMKSMRVVDEFGLAELRGMHKEIGDRVMQLDDTLEVIDELIQFVSPKAMVGK